MVLVHALKITNTQRNKKYFSLDFKIYKCMKMKGYMARLSFFQYRLSCLCFPADIDKVGVHGIVGI